MSVMNKSLVGGVVPPPWRQGAITPLLKPQKPATKLGSYRPRVLAGRLVKQPPCARHGIARRPQRFCRNTLAAKAKSALTEYFGMGAAREMAGAAL